MTNIDHSVADIMLKARELGFGIPAFNIPYLPMVEPVCTAVKDANAFALIEVARLDWMKFEARGLAAVAEAFGKWADRDYVRLHLDHVPVIDEDQVRVDYMPIFREAVSLGFESLMVDGSRLPLEENIRVTAEVAEFGHARGRPVEAELGAVLGHESGPLPPYEELFASGQGFTDVAEAQRFVQGSGCDWLSVAAGNIHGAIAAGARDQKKVEARLSLDRLAELSAATGRPLVLHGGSGIQREHVLAAFKHGITKVNVATEIRQAYEQAFRAANDVPAAQHACYERTRSLLFEYFCIAGIQKLVTGQTSPESVHPRP